MPTPPPTEPIYVGPIKYAEAPDGAEIYVRIHLEGEPGGRRLSVPIQAVVDGDEPAFIRLTPLPSDPSSMEMHSGVSFFDGHPFVSFRWGAEDGQLSPAEVRAHAMALLEAAEAAEGDALVFRVFQRTGMEVSAAVAMVGFMREERKIGWPPREPAPVEDEQR